MIALSNSLVLRSDILCFPREARVKHAIRERILSIRFRRYEPSQYESNELEDDRFVEGTYYPHLCKTRCFLVYREIAERLPDGGKICDLGFFPGTLLRQLKLLLNDRIQAYGVGLKVDQPFESFMRSYIEGCANIELDPFYSTSKARFEFHSTAKRSTP